MIHTVAWDTETALITDMVKAPALTCVSHAMRDSQDGKTLHVDLFKWDDRDARDVVASWLENDLNVGANIAYDMAVVMRQWPELTPLIFEAYEQNRVGDVQVSAKLVDNAHGEMHRHAVSVKGPSGKPSNYSLAALALRFLGKTLDKDTYRMGYGELRDVPLEQWEPGARQYPIDDAVSTLEVWEAEQLGYPELLADQFRQARHAFWLHLVGVHGIVTDPVRVAHLEARLRADKDDITQRLITAGLLHPKQKKNPKTKQLDWARNTKNAKARMMASCREQGRAWKETDAGDVCLDKEVCADSGDELLESYARFTSLTKRLGTEIKALKLGEIHCRFDSFMSNGRSNSSDPTNLQNLPREGGERECYVPRPGFVFVDCLAPGTRILGADLRWYPVEGLQVGQELVGFDEKLDGRQTKFRRASVEAVTRSQHPCYRIRTSRGSVAASFNHQWVARANRGRGTGIRRWVATEDLKVGDKISFLAEPWDVDESREGGYLAGFFDGEGYVSSGVGVGWGQNPGPLSAYVQELLTERGFPFFWSAGSGRCQNFRLLGGKEQCLRFLGSIRPRRLLPKAKWEGCQTWGKKSTPAEVLEVTFLGMQETVSVKTSTSTFIAEGFLSHNCDYDMLELRTWAQVCLETVGQSTLADDLNASPPVDVHLAMGGEILGGIPYAEMKARKGEKRVKEARQTGKPVNFMLPGGGGAERLVDAAKKDYGILLPRNPELDWIEKKARVGGEWKVIERYKKPGVEAARQLIAAWHRKRPEARLYLDMVSQMVRDAGGKAVLKALFVDRYHGGLGYCDLANYHFSCLANDIAKDAGWKVSRECYDWTQGSVLYGSRIVNFPHDQIIAESPIAVAPECAQRVGVIMVEAAKPWLPDVPATTTPCLATCFSKMAEAYYDDAGRLIPWSLEGQVAKVLGEVMRHVVSLKP